MKNTESILIKTGLPGSCKPGLEGEPDIQTLGKPEYYLLEMGTGTNTVFGKGIPQ